MPLREPSEKREIKATEQEWDDGEWVESIFADIRTTRDKASGIPNLNAQP